MPQVTNGGKFVFGWSRVSENGAVTLPPQAIREYNITSEGKVILFTGSKSTGGFCVTRAGLWLPSKLGFVLKEHPGVARYIRPPFTWTRIKGRSYCWAAVSREGEVILPPETLDFLGISVSDELLSIRSSDIAFTMGHHGPLVERAKGFAGIIEVY